MRRLGGCAVACALSFATSAFAAPADLATTILTRMAQPGSASTPFIEVSYRSMLDRPLIVSGEMKWLGGDKLERDVTKPYNEVARIGDGQLSVQRGKGAAHVMPIAHAPQIGVILSGFRAMLGGNAAQLAQDFNLAAAGNPARWVLTLTPRDRDLQHRIQSIVIDGRDDQPRCMTMQEADGDATITLLGAMAKAGLQSVAPMQSALAARCRNQ